MAKRIVKTEKYFSLQEKLEPLMPGRRILWETEVGNFTLTCYSYGDGDLLISQNFHDGAGIFTYLQTRGNSWQLVAEAIAKNLSASIKAL